MARWCAMPAHAQTHSVSVDGGRGGCSAIGVAGRYGLARCLLYGTGMRLMEGLRLRVKDVDFDRGALGQVRQGLCGDAAAQLGRRSAQTGACGARFGNRTAKRNAVASRSRIHWRPSTQAWDNAGASSGCSPLHPCRWSRARASGSAITSMRSVCSVP